MKYIVLGKTDTAVTHEVPIIFPNFMVHSLVADAMLAYPNMQDYKVVAAGDIHPSLLTCSGDSESLGVASRGREDEQLIGSINYTHGFV